MDGNGETTEVSFEVNVPEVATVTKGISDASTTNELICQVFLNDANKTPIPELTQTVPIDVTTHKATVKFSLMKRNSYAFIFWAQAKDTGYYDTEDLRSIKMNVENVKANEPMMDAFCATGTMITSSAPRTEKVTLRRALAQVNFGTVLPDRADVLTIKSSSVKLTGVPDTFHPFFGAKAASCEGSVDITFKDNAPIVDEKLEVNDIDYTYVATAYVFAPKEVRLLTDASTKVTFDNDKYTTVEVPNAPYQGNYRTNILGNLLMVDAEWNVSIDSKFGGDDIEYDAVSANLEAGKNVTLSEDYSVKDAGALVRTADGTMAVLDLNGHSFVNSGDFTKGAKAALQVHGNLTIKGDGTVSCNGGPYASNAIVLESGAHLIIEGGYYFVNKADNGTSNATIYVSDNGYPEKKCLVEIYGGKFEAEAGNDGTPFVLNQADGIAESCFVVYGGTFVGFNPAAVNENHGNITSFVAPGYKSVKDGNCYKVVPETGYEGAVLPEAPDMTGTVVNVNAENAQYTLDGAYGSINGKTINFTENITEALILGRPTKYSGSNTKYMVGGFDESAANYQEFATSDELVAYKSQSAWTPGCFYIRTLENVKFTANENVTLKGINYNSGHIYGQAGSPIYDYARDKGVWCYDTNDGYSFAANFKNISFEGIHFTANLFFENSSTVTDIDGLTFKNCTFTTEVSDKDAGSAGMCIRLGNFVKPYTNNYKSLVVDGCTFENAAHGVYCNAVYGVKVVNSEFKNLTRPGVSLQGTGSIAYGKAEICGNTFVNLTDRVIRINELAEDTSLTIRDNVSTNSGRTVGEEHSVMRAESLADGIVYDICNNDWNGGTGVVDNEQLKDKQ